MSGFKACTKCERLLPISEFYMLARGGRRADCRSCCTDAAITRQRESRVPCDDCGQRLLRAEFYRIRPPTGRAVRLCPRCWDGLVGAAVMAVR